MCNIQLLYYSSSTMRGNATPVCSTIIRPLLDLALVTSCHFILTPTFSHHKFKKKPKCNVTRRTRSSVLENDDPRPKISHRIWKTGSRATHEHHRGQNLKAMCKGCHRLWIKVPFDEHLHDVMNHVLFLPTRKKDDTPNQ